MCPEMFPGCPWCFQPWHKRTHHSAKNRKTLETGAEYEFRKPNSPAAASKFVRQSVLNHPSNKDAIQRKKQVLWRCQAIAEWCWMILMDLMISSTYMYSLHLFLQQLILWSSKVFWYHAPEILGRYPLASSTQFVEVHLQLLSEQQWCNNRKNKKLTRHLVSQAYNISFISSYHP